MNNKYLTIGALTRYLKNKFDSDNNLKTVFLKGEISNFKRHTSGHFYFSLKDETSKINAIMFRTNASKINFEPEDGSKVLVVGRISIFEATGNYQIYVEDMKEDGVGNLYIAYEKLKKELEKKGYFNKEHKKPIPKIPRKVGVITASTGAAVRDIFTTIKRRYPVCQIFLFPCLVQGENSKADLVQKIKQAENYDLDVLIIGRGGGSIEDLWPFNEEIVADAIYNSNIPIISAVGHETDFTIADFVADLRAPTPTAAAELAVPNLIDLLSDLDNKKIRIKEATIKKITTLKLNIDKLKNSYVIKNPLMMFDSQKQKLDNITEKINNTITNFINKYRETLNLIKKSYILNNPVLIYKDKKNNLNTIITKLELLNPLTILKKGYSVAYLNNQVVKNIKQIKKNDNLKLIISNGIINTKVLEVKENNNGKEI